MRTSHQKEPKPMIIRQESGDRWLPVQIGDFEKWPASLATMCACGASSDPPYCGWVGCAT